MMGQLESTRSDARAPEPKAFRNQGRSALPPVLRTWESGADAGAVNPATLIIAVSIGLLGAVLASFAAATGSRLATGETLGGRSHCACGRPLRPNELVPVVSYLAHGGRARCCGARIGAESLVGELVGAAVPVIAFAVGGPAIAVVALAVTTVGIGLDAARRVRR
jgi:hypothetical protein